jgi:hypothetical protein
MAMFPTSVRFAEVEPKRLYSPVIEGDGLRNGARSNPIRAEDEILSGTLSIRGFTNRLIIGNDIRWPEQSQERSHAVLVDLLY